MAKKFTFESAQERIDRFSTAKERKVMWDSLLQEAYRYTVPNADDFTIKERQPGEPRTNNLWDYTAVEALQTFASNLQTALMPVLQRWATLEAAPEVGAALSPEINAKLEKTNEIIFRYINESNLSQAFYESALDLGIGTGVLLLNEGPDEDPLRFTSVRISNVYFEEGENHKLENFWREIQRIPYHLIPRFWPQAKLTPGLRANIKRNPYGEVELVEGTIFYPNNPPGRRYLYYVQEKGIAHDIVFEWRDFSPWVGFRYSVASGEIMGRGPVLTVLPGIRVLNIMTETILRGAQLRIDPPWIAASNNVFNPYNINIEPGTVIAVDPSLMAGGGDPLKALVPGGDINFGQLSIETLQANIREILFASPLGPVPTPNVTATETTIRNEAAEDKRGPAFGRLLVELLQPLMEKIIFVLRRKGLIENIKIEGKNIKIRYESPLAEIQAQQDLQRFETWFQVLQATLAEEALAAVNFDELPEWSANKLNVDPVLVNEGFKNSPVVQSIKKTVNQGPPEQQTPPPQTQVPSQQQAAPTPQGVLAGINALDPTAAQEAGPS